MTFGTGETQSKMISHRSNNQIQLFTLMPDQREDTATDLNFGGPTSIPSERAMCANELDKTTSETLFNKYTPTKCDTTPINTKRTVEVMNKN